MAFGWSYADLYQSYLDNYDPADGGGESPMSYDEYLDMIYSEQED